MSGARGKIEVFEPSNVAGLDTRVWQARGSASDVDGVVFSLRGEIVKVGGLQKLLRWRYRESSDEQPALTVAAEIEDNPFVSGAMKASDRIVDTILTIGTYVWDGTTELVIAHYRPPKSAFSFTSTKPTASVIISVLETDTVREIHSYPVARELPRPRFYPRFADVGPYLLILVDGMIPVKWDGRITSFVGIRESPEPVQAALLFGTGDKLATFNATVPTEVGDFWEEHSFDQNDATGLSVSYFQTYINKYGQESNMSAPSNRLVLNEALGVVVQSVVSSGDEDDPDAVPTIEREADGLEFNDRLVAFLSLGNPPSQLDIVQRSLYRSIGGQSPTALPRRLGVGESTHFDTRKLGQSSITAGPAPGENDAPPNSRWAFPFRGRVYYRGEAGSLIYYSKLNFPEAVSATNFIEINTNDGDVITAWGVSQDYAILFKRKSAYLLTHDKEEEPVITPLQSTFGAVTDRGVVSFDNNTYFLSDIGFHVFDGSTFTRLSVALDERVRLLPTHTRENVCVFADRAGSRVYICVNANPGVDNNEVWAIHVETGAFSIIKDRSISAAIPYKGEVVVASASPSKVARFSGPVIDEPNLFLWNTGYDFAGSAYAGSFSTEWLELKNPHSDKRFYKLLLYFVQTGAVSMTVDWFLDWDDTASRGTTTVTLDDTGASSEWDEGVWDDGTTDWDSARLVSKFVDLSDTSSTGTAQTIDAKSIRLVFSTLEDTRTQAVVRGTANASDFAQTPFKLVGWQVLAQDFGERAEGSSPR